MQVKLRGSHIAHEPAIHTHPFNGPLSGTTQVSRYQTGKTQSAFYWSKGK